MLSQYSKMKSWQAVLYMALLLIAIALMFALRRCNTSPGPHVPLLPSTTVASGNDTIDVAIEYSPACYYSYADTLGGFDYDLLRLISKVSGVTFKFHSFVALGNALQGLENGNYDLLVAQFPITGGNKQKYLFTNELYLDKQILVQRVQKGGKVAIKTQLDLAGDTVRVVKNSPMRERVEGLSREIGYPIHVVEDESYGPEQLFLQVASGEIKYAVINERIARQLAKKYQGKIDVTTAISFSQFQSWTLRKDNQKLCDFINHWLKVVKSTAEYQTLTKDYFN